MANPFERQMKQEGGSEEQPEEVARGSVSGKKMSPIKKLIATGALAASAIAGMGSAERGGAQQEHPQQRTEQRHLNGTESSRWAVDMMRQAKADLPKVKTKEDAEWLVRTYFEEGLMKEFYFPTKGVVSHEKVYDVDVASRTYGEDDGDIISENFESMGKIMADLNSRFGLEGYANRVAQLADMERKIKDQASYAGRKERETLDKASEGMR